MGAEVSAMDLVGREAGPVPPRPGRDWLLWLAIRRDVQLTPAESAAVVAVINELLLVRRGRLWGDTPGDPGPRLPSRP